MMSQSNSSQKLSLHPRNKNRDQYDMDALIDAVPELTSHIVSNKRGEKSINFSNPISVKVLNRALLNHYYGITFWEFPDMNLCPPIPGRADYIHYVADILAKDNDGKVPEGDDITCLDIGTGASCIYPSLAVSDYNWNCIGSDINQDSLTAAEQIVENNELLKDKVELRLQSDPNHFFKNIIKSGEQITISICNPPFHSSIEAAERGTKRKIKNLSGKHQKEFIKNFSGIENELVYEGGEFEFIKKMMIESKDLENQVQWFSSLVSKESNLKPLKKVLNKLGVVESKTVSIKTGNKASRIIFWSYHTRTARKTLKKQSK